MSIKPRDEQHKRSAPSSRQAEGSEKGVSKSNQTSGEQLRPQKRSREEMKEHIRAFMADHKKLYRELAK